MVHGSARVVEWRRGDSGLTASAYEERSMGAGSMATCVASMAFVGGLHGLHGCRTGVVDFLHSLTVFQTSSAVILCIISY
jgi:hypothetical protein